MLSKKRRELKIIILGALVVAALNACALAPLTEEHTARTLGEGGNEWDFSVGAAYMSASYTRGFSERLDLGVILEAQMFAIYLLGAKGKYLLFENKETGAAFSTIFGVGAAAYSKYGYLGLIQSYRPSQKYELSLNTRVNIFNWDFENQNERDDAEDLTHDFFGDIFETTNGSHTYISADVSNTYWFTHKFGTTFSIGGVKFLGKDSEVGEALKGGIKFHFNY